MTLDAILVPIAAAVAGGILGSTLTHFFSARRDIAVKRRELILTNLMQALEEIEKSSVGRPGADLKQLEKVIFRVQMVGQKSMVEIANDAVMKLTTTGNAVLTPLYIALRAKIRRELRLEPIEHKYMGLVIRKPGDPGFEDMKKNFGAEKTSG